MTIKTIKLTPPKLSQDNIKEKITCIRAHRERIFNVSTESLEDKLIVHNYGQGGAGWTFLFGCVKESIRLFEKEFQDKSNFQNKNITVIGAGCYGLLTAIILTRMGYEVEIVASETENITSYKSGGFFFPRWRKCSNEQEIREFKSMGLESYKTYLNIINNNHPFIKTGPKILPAYYSPDIDPGFGPYIEQNLLEKPQEVIIDFGNSKTYRALEYKAVFINSSVIMQELHRNIKELNIKINIKNIKNFYEISNKIIFNCAGLGSKELAQDKRIVPVQGHLISLQNQDNLENLQYLLNFKVIQNTPDGRLRDELIYFAPKESGILGITFLRGQDNLEGNQHEFDRLISRCKDFFGT